MLEFFQLRKKPSLKPRYNIPPTSKIGVVVQEGDQRRLAACRWGLIPSWAKDPDSLPLLFNARQETIFEKASFSDSILCRRCLIPANSFFEWQIYDKKQRQPYCIQPEGFNLFAFAGIWDCWYNPKGEAIYSTAIITTAASASIKQLHHRMPVVLNEGDFDAWFTPETTVNGLKEILARPVSRFSAFPVSSLVNSLENQGQETVQPIDLDSSDSSIVQKRLL